MYVVRAPEHRLDRSEIAAFDRFEVAAFDRFGIAAFGVMLSRKGIPKIKYEGPDSHNPLAFRFYNAEQALQPLSRSMHRAGICA